MIGRFLPRDALEARIPAAARKLSAEPAGFHDAARGMKTTDTFPKQATRLGEVGGANVRISGATMPYRECPRDTG